MDGSLHGSPGARPEAISPAVWLRLKWGSPIFVVVAVRDDSAWPRHAAPISVLIGGAALVVGILVAVNHERPLAAGLFLLASLIVGASLIVISIRRWLSGQSIPWWLGLVGGIAAIAGSIVAEIVTGSNGFPVVASGTVSGMLLANVWAIRTARENRASASS
jgi:hypothetical protein